MTKTIQSFKDTKSEYKATLIYNGLYFIFTVKDPAGRVFIRAPFSTANDVLNYVEKTLTMFQFKTTRGRVMIHLF